MGIDSDFVVVLCPSATVQQLVDALADAAWQLSRAGLNTDLIHKVLVFEPISVADDGSAQWAADECSVGTDVIRDFWSAHGQVTVE